MKSTIGSLVPKYPTQYSPMYYYYCGYINIFRDAKWFPVDYPVSHSF